MSWNYDLTLRFVLPRSPLPEGVTLQPVEILAEYPHDPGAFTQGLLWSEGRLFESSGGQGVSELREVRLEDGAVLARTPFPVEAWGEGIADWGDEIVALTLASEVALRWKRDGLVPCGSPPCPGAGWGLARVGDSLVASDGSPRLCFLDPEDMTVRRMLDVREAGAPLAMLNDLAFVRGELLANVFMTDTIARIDPDTGTVASRLDLSAVVARSGRRDPTQVLNGIAWDEAGSRLFVTGKNWPTLFEISLPSPPDR